MPGGKQKTVTIHSYIWGLVNEVYREKEDYWLAHNVRSPTSLVAYWLLEKIREHRNIE